MSRKNRRKKKKKSKHRRASKGFSTTRLWTLALRVILLPLLLIFMALMVFVIIRIVGSSL